jgi:GDP-mannose 6-dehydrogenase
MLEMQTEPKADLITIEQSTAKLKTTEDAIETRRISVFGLGYVGSLTAACMADQGHRVIGVDINPAKVEMLDSGLSPIKEAQLDELTAKNHRACRLRATTDVTAAVCETDISFLCVGTPSLRNGKLDLSSVEHACREIGEALRYKKTFHLVVVRSTVLPGTTQSCIMPWLEKTSGKRAEEDFAVCFNPEFMREGSAVEDFFHPPYTILGALSPRHLTPLRQLYRELPGPVFETSLAVAEMVKYMSNAFHALKVDFANEVGTLSKQLGVDTEEVTRIFLADTRLNVSSAYLAPGFAFGGSCLPKDLRALMYRAKELDLRLPLLESIISSNSEHIERAVDAVLRSGKKKVAVLGLSFKAGTDDLRESPLIQLIKRLLGEGCEIRVWDPNVSMWQLMGTNRRFIEEAIPHIGSLLSANLKEVVEGAEIVVVGTKAAAKNTLASYLRPGQVVLDLVNLERGRRANGAPLYEGICW